MKWPFTRRKPPPPPPLLLTNRQQEVLALAATGHTNQAIANHLGITYQTVKFHLGQANKRLGTTNRTGAIHRARQLGELP